MAFVSSLWVFYEICFLYYGTAHFQLHAREHWIASECLFFLCTLLKLACSIIQLTCSITPLACLSLLVVMGLLVCARALTRAACIANMLRVLVARYMFTPVSCVHYLSSGISPVNIRIGKHIRKGRELVLLVTGPAKINHLSANFTEFLFLLIPSIKNAVSHFCKLHKKAH